MCRVNSIKTLENRISNLQMIAIDRARSSRIRIQGSAADVSLAFDSGVNADPMFKKTRWIKRKKRDSRFNSLVMQLKTQRFLCCLENHLNIFKQG